MRPDRVVTRTGDDGTTGLLSGRRTRKDDPVLDACGTLDEWGALLGRARVSAIEGIREDDARRLVVEGLDACQDGAMRLAADLSAEGAYPLRLVEADVADLDRRVDSALARLPESRAFRLPGTSRAEADLHVARSICRRAERVIVRLEGPSGPPRRWLNRASDLLYALARLALVADGIPEREWHPSPAPPTEEAR
jgi:cob(I)alamin adenosyltransferase